MFVFSCFPESEIGFDLNLPGSAKKRLLDSQLGNVVNRPASGLVRFSYKSSVFRIAGFVLCYPEAAGF